MVAAGTPHLDNLLAHVPALRLATWVLQVMPVFFFAGSIASGISWQRSSAKGITWTAWSYGRLARPVRPVAVYLGLWIPFVLIISATLGPKVATPLATLTTQLLWFLGVYIPVTVATPWLVRATARAPWTTPAAMLAVAAVCDIARLETHLAVLGLINFVVVWGMAGQLGLTMQAAKPSRRVLVGILLAGLAANTLLIIHGPWPVSMVGLPGEAFSNMAPPSLVLAIHCWVLAAAVMLAWPALVRFAQRAKVWTYTVAIGGSSMTLYLWHLTALIFVVIAEHEIGINRGVAVGTWGFWGLTALHIVIALVVIWTLVTIFAPFEHRELPWLDHPHPGPGRPYLAGVAYALCGAAFLMLSATGMGGFPFSRVTHYAGIPLTPGMSIGVLICGVAVARFAAGGEGVDRADRTADGTAV